MNKKGNNMILSKKDNPRNIKMYVIKVINNLNLVSDNLSKEPTHLKKVLDTT